MRSSVFSYFARSSDLIMRIGSSMVQMLGKANRRYVDNTRPTRSAHVCQLLKVAKFGRVISTGPFRGGKIIIHHVPTVRTVGYFHTARFPGEEVIARRAVRVVSPS